MRRAYIATKVVVFAVAALITWPLSKAIGPEAWWGLAVFGVVLIVLGVAVLGLPGAGSRARDDDGVAVGDGVSPEQGTVELPIEDWIDLHPFPPRDITGVVTDYLEAAHAKGFREVRLIHGRGIGVQRERVRSALAQSPFVEEYHDAPPERGGWGATIASLKRDT
jgi:hypothetical protein